MRFFSAKNEQATEENVIDLARFVSKWIRSLNEKREAVLIEVVNQALSACAIEREESKSHYFGASFISTSDEIVKKKFSPLTTDNIFECFNYILKKEYQHEPSAAENDGSLLSQV